MLPLLLLCSSALISVNYGHSWVRCSDYDGTITGGDYDESNCNGWIRSWTFNNIEFGQDRGINHQVAVGSGQNLCPAALSSSALTDYSDHYSDPSKLARYSVGEQVQVVWPAKNHANYECFNFIPDTSMKLFMNPNVNPNSDLPNTAATMTENGYELVKDWHEGCDPMSDGCGFQNCPKFCDNTDRATCFQYFTVPSVSQSGYYTFVWYWIFNPGTPYISCFEAYIDASGNTASSSTSSTTSSTQTSSTGSSTSTSSSGEYSNEYITHIPYCVTGAEYNEITTYNFVERHFEDYLQEAEFGVFEVTEGINSFDFILQFSHQGSDVASITNAANTYCDEYIAVYGIDKTCTICEDMMTFRVFVTDDNDGNENESDSAVSAKNDGGNEWLTWFIMSVGIFIVCGCVIFVLVHRWCRKEIRKKKESYYPTKAQVNAHKYGPSDKNRLEHNVTSHAVVAVNDA